eukprot:gene8766-9499_t
MDWTGSIGINYEGGKIIDHILRYHQCLAYANLQIVMDKPYTEDKSKQRIANDSLRFMGRSEKQFDPNCDERIKSTLLKVLKIVRERFSSDILIVFQIARGKSATDTIDTIVTPLLHQLQLKNYRFVIGYRSSNYYCHESEESFVFINIGMFAVLSEGTKISSDTEDLLVGEICNPVLTQGISGYSETDGFVFDSLGKREFSDERNLLGSVEGLTRLLLYGIADEMPFVLPDHYAWHHVRELV